MTKSERETTVNLCEADDYAEVYSTESRFWKACERAGWKLVLKSGPGRTYRGPKGSLRITLKSAARMEQERARGRLAAQRFKSALPAGGN